MSGKIRLLQTRSKVNFSTALILAAIFLLAFGTIVLAGPNTGVNNNDLEGGQSPFFSLNGTLNPGQTISPIFPLGTPQRQINFSLEAAGSGPLSLVITNGSGGGVWNGQAQSGETLWGTGTLTNGNNKMQLTNNGGAPVNFDLNLYDLPPTPYTWSGSAAPSGLNSEVRVNFPSSGLYTFDFSVNGGGRFQFSLDGDHIQKSIVANATADLYVAAGVHTLEIVQDPTGGQVNWSVDLTYTGSTSDSLPYTATGTDISEEWLPIFLDNAAQVNVVTSVSGAAGDTLDVEIANPAFSPSAVSNIYTGEEHWMTLDLPAGLSYIHLAANGGYVDYNLSLDALPTTNYTWSGTADPAGENSHARLTFASDGLYTFNFGTGSGERYQFLLDIGGESYIQNTIEANGVITSFVPAGTHDLILDQDTTTGADWEVAIAFNASGNTPIPYTKEGGDIGGAGNDFTQEWLPIAQGAGGTVNMRFEASGATTDSFVIAIYQDGSSTPDYIISQVLGTEELWATFDLSAGINLIRIVADGGNAGPMSYDLLVDNIPGGGNAAWNGNSLAAGLNAAYTVNFPSAGLYRFSLNSPDGFANLVLDDNLLTGLDSFGAVATTYDIMVNAGPHEIHTIQDPAYSTTEWSASVQPITAATSFFTFNGSLDPGDSVTPVFPVNVSALPFNFEMAVSGGGPVHLTIENGSAGTVWDGQGENGETVWGTGSLTNGSNTFAITNNGGSAATVSLVLYTVPTVPYTWSGEANPGGENSTAQLTFPTSGLYTFNLDVTSGRYQFLLNTDYIRKTAESDTTVTYFVPAGTHTLTLLQDTAVGADWSVNITGPGGGNDTLPYSKNGGDLGGPGNDFTEEWLPIQLSAGTQANLSLALNGTTGDSLFLEVFAGSPPASSIYSTTIYADETRWASFDLPAGTSLIQLTADNGNSSDVAYDLDIASLPTPPTTWSGTAAPNGGHSSARMVFPTAGLYTFNFGLSGGRYQFHLNEDFIQKTVETPGSVTLFVPAGTHDLTIVQDTGSGADWSVNVTGPGPAVDSLPYTKSGGNIGGGGNDFTEEWFPINPGADTPVNLRLDVNGSTADNLVLELRNMANTATLLTLDPVYGSEQLWATVDLPAAGALVHLSAAGGNAADLSYDLAVVELPTPPTTWEGVSLDVGLQSTIRMSATISGTYLVQVNLPDGFANIEIDDAPSAAEMPANASASGFYYEFETPLSNGEHTFTTVQDTSFTVTTWVVTTTLLSADAPAVFSTDIDLASDATTTPLTIFGFNFMPGITAALDDGSSTFPLSTITYVSSSEISAVIPAGLPVGVYDIVVTNPDSKTGSLADALEIYQPITGLTAANDGPTLLGEATSFTASVATGSDVVYSWDFGDGNGGSGANPSHTYASAGQYTATVTATNVATNATTTTQVTVFVGSFEIYLPAVLKS